MGLTITCDACKEAMRHNGRLDNLVVEGVIVKATAWDGESAYFHNQCWRVVNEAMGEAMRGLQAKESKPTP